MNVMPLEDKQTSEVGVPCNEGYRYIVYGNESFNLLSCLLKSFTGTHQHGKQQKRLHVKFYLVIGYIHTYKFNT